VRGRRCQSKRFGYFLSARALLADFADVVEQRDCAIQELSTRRLIDLGFVFQRVQVCS